MANPSWDSTSTAYAGAVNACRPGTYTFYAAGLYWVTYTVGNKLYVNSSADNASWGTAIDLGATTTNAHAATFFDGTYFHYVRETALTNSTLYYRRGTPVSDGTISWSAAEQSVDTNKGYGNQSITVDSGGHAWIGTAYTADAGVTVLPVVYKNDNTDGTWSSAAGFPYTLKSPAPAQYWAVYPAQMSNGDTYCVYTYGTLGAGIVYGKNYSGGWGAEETPSTTWAINNHGYTRFACNGSKIAIVFCETGYYHHAIIGTSGSWTESNPVGTADLAATDQVAVCMSESGVVYLVYTKNSATSHAYLKYTSDNGSNWSSEQDLYTGDAAISSNALTCSPARANGMIIVLAPDASHLHCVLLNANANVTRSLADTLSLTDSVKALNGTVATTTSATGAGYQHKSFFAYGLHWVLYSDGTDGLWKTSPDGLTWSAAQTFKAGVVAQSIWNMVFDGTYVHYVYLSTSTNAYYRRGLPDINGDITWSAAEQTVALGSVNNTNFTTLCVNTSGYAFIGYRYVTGGGATYYPYVIKNADNDGTWTTDSDSQMTAGACDGSARAVVTALSDGSVYCCYNLTGTGAIKGKLWTSAGGWGGEETPSDVHVIPAYQAYSVASYGTNVYLAMRELTTNDTLVFHREGGSWTVAEDNIEVSTVAQNPAISVNADGDLVVLVEDYPAGHVSYYTRVGTTWTEREWITDANTKSGFGWASEREQDEKIGFVYLCNAGSPYDIKYIFLSFPRITDTLTLTDAIVKRKTTTATDTLTLTDAFTKGAVGPILVEIAEILQMTGDPYLKSVGVADTSLATNGRAGRCNFYAAGRYWTFFFLSSHEYYTSSADNVTWLAETEVGGTDDDRMVAAWFDGTYVHYIRFLTADAGIGYRRGLPVSDGSITWSAAEQLIDTSVYDSVTFMSVTVDATGHAWIGGATVVGLNLTPRVWRNANTDGTWATDAGFPYAMAAAAAYDWETAPMCLSNGDVYVAYWGAQADATQTKGKLWNHDTAVWGGEETITTETAASYYGRFTTNGTDCVIGYIYSTTELHIVVRRGSTWYGPIAISTAGHAYGDIVTTTMDANGNVYCFYTKGGPGKSVYMKYFTQGSLSAETLLWTDALTQHGREINSFPIVQNGEIGVSLTNDTYLHFLVVPVPFATYSKRYGDAHMTDTLALTDAILKRYGDAHLADTLPLTDLVLKMGDAHLADTLTLTDVAYRSKTFPIPDTLTLTDAVVKRKTTTATDTLTLTDAISLALRRKHITDTLLLTDAITLALRRKHITDTLLLTDAFVKGARMPITDTLTLTDVVVKRATKPVTDTLALTDAILKRYGDAHIADTLTLTDAVLKMGDAHLADTLTLTDAVVKRKSFSLAETLTLTDAVLKRYGDAHLTDTLLLTDAFTKGKSFILTDTLTLTDAVVKRKSFSLAETLTLTDAILKMGDAHLADSLLLTDATKTNKGLIISQGMRFASSISDTGLVAYYNMEAQTDAGKLADLSGNGHDGTASGGVLIGEKGGVVGRATEFDGVNDYVEVSDSPSLRPTNLTQTVWIKFSSAPGASPIQFIVKNYGTGSDESYGLWYYGASFAGCAYGFHATVYTDHTTCYAMTPTVDEWYFLAHTFDDSTKKSVLYINGIAVSTKTLTGKSLTYDDKPFNIGMEYENNTKSFYFGGSIDEVRIYDRALSADEVKALYEETVLTNKTLLQPDSLLLSDTTLRGKSFALADTLTLTDAILKMGDAHIADTLTLTDAVRRNKSLPITDTIALTDAVLASRRAIITDTLLLTDSVVKSKSFALTDVLTLTDAITRPIRKLAVTDSLALSDLIYRGRTANLTDTITLSDSATLHRFVSAVTDSLTLTDEIIAYIDLEEWSVLKVKTVTDDLYLTDVFTAWQIGATLVEIADAIAMAEAILKVMAEANVTDTLQLTDSITRPYKGLPITDTLTLTDSILKRFGGASLADTLALADAMLKHGDAHLTDSLGVADAILKRYGDAHLADALSLTDVPLTRKTFTLSDALTLTDAILRSGVFSVTDALALTDALLAHKKLTLADTLQLTDAVLTRKTFTLTDLITLTDAITRPFKGLPVTDVLTLSDAMRTDRRLPISDTLSSTDAILKRYGDAHLNDSMALSDTPLVGRTLTLTDLLILTDAITRPYRGLPVTDSLLLSDSALTSKNIVVPDSFGFLGPVSDDQLLQNAADELKFGQNTRWGQRKTLTNKYVVGCGFLLNKVNNPTGNVYARIRKVSDDSIIVSKLLTLAENVAATATWYDVTFDSLVYVNEEVRILCEYTSQDENNGLAVYEYQLDVKAGEYLSYYHGGYDDFADHDATYHLTVIGPSDMVYVSKHLLMADHLYLTDSIHKHRYVSPITDALTFTDALLAHKRLIITDTLTLADLMYLGRVASLTDALSMTDAILKRYGDAHLADALGLTDAILKMGDAHISDTISLVDALLRDKGLSVPESMLLTDSLLTHKGLVVADALTLTDEFIQEAISHILEILDTLGLVDSFTAIKLRAITDSLSLTDTVTLALVRKVLTDSLNLTDVSLVSKRVILTDVINLLDSIEVLEAGVRDIYEALGLGDSITVPYRTRLITDFLTLTDSLLLYASKLVLETLTLTDTVQVPKTKYATDSLTLSDIYLTHRNLGVLDTINLSDLVLRHRSTTIVDTIQLLDSIIRNKGLTIPDNLANTDSLLIHKSLLLTDVLNLAEQIATNKALTIQDLLTLTEAIARHKNVELADTLVLVDEVLRHKTLSIQDAIVLSDTLLLSALHIIIDGLGTGESPLVSKYGLTITDALTLDDVIEVILYKLIEIADSLHLDVTSMDLDKIIGSILRKYVNDYPREYFDGSTTTYGNQIR
jgi:hypothetical protein